MNRFRRAQAAGVLDTPLIAGDMLYLSNLFIKRMQENPKGLSQPEVEQRLKAGISLRDALQQQFRNICARNTVEDCAAAAMDTDASPMPGEGWVPVASGTKALSRPDIYPRPMRNPPGLYHADAR